VKPRTAGSGFGIHLDLPLLSWVLDTRFAKCGRVERLASVEAATETSAENSEATSRPGKSRNHSQPSYGPPSRACTQSGPDHNGQKEGKL
jgi:hypothetical protein